MTVTEPPQPRTLTRDRPTIRDAVALLDEVAATPSHVPSVEVALHGLISVLDGQRTDLLDEIQHSEPRLSRRISDLRHSTTELSNRARYLRHSLMHPSLDTTITRSQLVELVRSARKLQTAESDIIFDALNTDLGAGD